MTDEELIASFEDEMASENIIQWNPENFDRLIALARKGAAISSEMVVVPRELTDEMLEAADNAMKLDEDLYSVYRAMISAAPSHCN